MRWLENPFHGWIDNEDIVIENELFSRTIDHSENEIKVALDLFNYGTKPDLKNATGLDTTKFAKKTDLTTIADKINETMSKNQAKLDWVRNVDICFCVIYDH